MTHDTPSFPEGDQVPSIEEMAESLVGTMPEAERAEARRLLVEDILPLQLADLASHPRPHKLARVVYERLAADLAEAPDGGELDALRARAWRDRAQHIERRALALAIARYLHDHPDAADAAGVASWLTPAVSEWRGQSREQIIAAATSAEQRLESLRETLSANQPTIWNQLRASVLRTRMTLGSAKTGSFDTAAGPLADFLRAAGHTHETMDFH